MLKKVAYLTFFALALLGCSEQSTTASTSPQDFDLMIVNGLVYDGYGGAPVNADIAIFDPVSIQDHATFGEPHQHSTGMRHVIVNGVQVLREGEVTGSLSGRFVKGPGYTGD